MGGAASKAVGAASKAVVGTASLVKDAAVATATGIRTGVAAGLDAARKSWLKTAPASSPLADLQPYQDALDKALEISKTLADKTATTGATDPGAFSLLLQEKQKADKEVERLTKVVEEKARSIQEDWPEPKGLTHDYVNIAVTGATGVGKSSFVNKICRRKSSDPGAARVGASAETTLEATFYTSERYPSVRFWDLPGACTTNNPAATYLRDRGIRYYDSLLIVGENRFTETDVALFKEATRWKIRANLVRNKCDQAVQNDGEENHMSELDVFATIVENAKTQCPGATPDCIFMIATKNVPPGSKIESEWLRLEAKVTADVEQQRATKGL